MAHECKECGSKDDYNFSLNIGLCNACIGVKLEENEWIPVSEGLPEGVKCDDVEFIADGIVEAGEFKNGLFWDNRGRSFESEDVTYWRYVILPDKE